MKKWMALILVLAMAVSFGTTAFAADADPCADVLTLSSASLALKTGESATLEASAGGAVLSEVSWSSSNPGVASVSGGLVTATALGRTMITATAADGRSATCAVHVVLKGIDVSSYQGTVDWAGVKSGGVDFTILRTGYGNEHPETQTDTTFSANYDGAAANGIKVGAYHASYATTPAEAVQEAQMCLSILNGRHLDYPVFFDLEQPAHVAMTSDQLAEVADAFCKTITSAGYRAGIYSNTSMFNSNLNSPVLNGYDKWVAHPNVSAANYSGTYTMWQCNHAGSIVGISGAVDLDYSYVDYPNGAQTPVDTTLISDTASSLSLKAGRSYQFKFTPNGISAQPKFTTGNSGVIKAVLQKTQDGSYYFKITAAGRGTTSVYSVLPNQKPVRRCVVTVV